MQAEKEIIEIQISMTNEFKIGHISRALAEGVKKNEAF